MKIAYIYNNRAEAPGVAKKIAAQGQFLSGDHSVVLVNLGSPKALNALTLALRADHLYCRDGLAVALFIIVFCLISKKKIALEVNNAKGSLSGTRSTFVLKVRQLLQKLALKSVNCLVGVTSEILLTYEPLQVNRIIVPNIWGWTDITHSSNEESTREKAKFTFVFLGDLNQLWQGKEQIIRLLELNHSWSLLVIGNATKWPSSVASRVTEVGVINCTQRQVILCRQAKIGLSALAFQGNRGLTQASPLKHLVYCEASIPIITGCVDHMLIESRYPHLVWNKTDTAEQMSEFVEGLGCRCRECFGAKKCIQSIVDDARKKFLEIFN